MPNVDTSGELSRLERWWQNDNGERRRVEVHEDEKHEQEKRDLYLVDGKSNGRKCVMLKAMEVRGCNCDCDCERVWVGDWTQRAVELRKR